MNFFLQEYNKFLKSFDGAVEDEINIYAFVLRLLKSVSDIDDKETQDIVSKLKKYYIFLKLFII